MYSEIELKNFYSRESIAVNSFDCANKKKCIEAALPRPLHHGAEAHVGSRYGEVLRIVVVALDTGHESADFEERRSIIEGLWGKQLNRHMQGTTELLQGLLKEQIEENTSPHPYYAMINAAKCSGADGKRDMVPGVLYDYCKPFAQNEIDLLKPQLLVAQGRKAASVLSAPQVPEDDLNTVARRITDNEEVQGWLMSFARQYLRAYKSSEGRYIPVLEAPHPSSRNGSWTFFKNVSLNPVVSLIRGLAEIQTKKELIS